MRSLGDAWIDVHGNTDPFERDVQRGVREGAEDAEDDARRAGEELGEEMADAIGDQLREEGPNLAREVEAGLRRQKIRTKVTVQLDKSGNEVRRWVTTITDDIQEAFTAQAAGRGGIFSRFGQGIADAIGAGFNVSGRSPLVAFLLPAIGAIIALVIGAIQAVNGLIALLVTIPGLLTSIGLQVGVLVIAFQGVGTAIQGAFAAKNAKELNEALKDLTPSAQEFVRSLLPLRDLFNELRPFIQENFFRGLGDIFGTGGALTPLIATLGALGPLANALGRFGQQIAQGLGSPAMVSFINDLIPVTTKWLDQFGPSFRNFIEGLAKFAGSPAVLDMLAQVGEWVTIITTKFGNFLFDLAGDEGFATWLDNMKLTLESVGNFLLAVLSFTTTLLNQLDQAGGREFIDQLTEGIMTLETFLASDTGKKGLEGLLHASLFLFQAFVGLIAVVLTFFAIMEKLGELINLVFRVLKEGLTGLFGDIVDFFQDAADEVERAIENLPFMMFTVGRNMIQSLIDGARSMIPSVRNIMGTIAAVVRGFWPFSPAKEGPLSGSGDPMKAGENIIHRLAAGITAGSAELGSVMNQSTSNIVFGPGAVRVGFNGALPTDEQAMQTGTATGAGILGMLARQAVRTA